MKKDKHIGIIIDNELHYKLHFLSKYEGRSANGEILYLVRQAIAAYEEKNGVIALPSEQFVKG